MKQHRTAALLLGVGTLASLVVAPAGATPASRQDPPSSSTAAGPVEKLTLITGDTVRYRSAGDTVQVVGTSTAPQRRRTAFARYTDDGHTYVVPQDAWAAVARGEVDKALFDITGLVRQRLDDRHTDRIGLIVTGRPGTAPKMATPATAEVTRTLPRLGMSALSTGKSQATTLWKALTEQRSDATGTGRAVTPAHGTRIWLDGVVRPTLDVSVPLVGAPTAWAHGHTGDGAKVAVLDTGISSTHPDLSGKVTAAKNFSTAPDTDDRGGHGTHVASTITGSGAASGGRYRGVAPDARLLNGKVLGDDGVGFDSWILAGMEWAVQQGADVVSMSLGGNLPSDGKDVLSTAVNDLSASSDTLFVIAAGNAGGPSTVTSPGAADAALTVASTTKQDTLSTFSSRGPRIGDFGVKPEISAPGQDIVAARAPGTLEGEPGDDDYVSLSGTSMATPHVAGAAAILAAEHPDWDGERIKAALTGSSTVLKGIDVFGNGAGRLDVARATGQSVRAVTASLGLGRVPWPHDPAKPTTGRVTYANDGDTPVTLALDLSVTGAKAAPVRAGLFSTEPTLTVPAHGTATATVRLAAGADDAGTYQGRLTATAADTRVVVPLTVRVDELLHPVRIRVLDRAGQVAAPGDAWVALQSEATGDYYPAALTNENSLLAEVPEGTYRVVGLSVFGATHTTLTYYARGGLRVDGARELTFDAAKGRPVTAELDDPAARPDVFTVDTGLVSTVPGTDTGIALTGNYTPYVVSEEALPGAALTYSAAWARPQNRVTTLGDDPFEVGDVEDLQPAGYEGDVTSELVDIGEQTDPDQIGDVKGKVVLLAPLDLSAGSADPPTQEALTALLAGLKAKGAALVLTYEYVADTAGLPALFLLRPEDVEGLRERAAAGQKQVHVVGQPVSPRLYALYGSVDTDLPHGQAWHFERDALVRTKAVYRNPRGERRLTGQTFFFRDAALGFDHATEQRLLVPQTREEYYTPGVAWSVATPVDLTADGSYFVEESSPYTVYGTGRTPVGVWGTAPFAPRLPKAPVGYEGTDPLPAAYRSGDRLVTLIPVFNGAGLNHVTRPVADTGAMEQGTTALFQGGTKVAESKTPGLLRSDLPAARGTYRLVVTARRPSELSPEVRSEWTFSTGRTEADGRTPLDLLDLGFTLPLDLDNSARAGRTLTGSLTVRHQSGSTGTAPVRKVTVDVSYDDGATWRRATVRDTGHGRWSLIVPAGGSPKGHVSLKTTAVSTAGDRLSQTVTRAYRLR
ncbi:S8 family serine peptidase [Streptomyces tendae]